MTVVVSSSSLSLALSSSSSRPVQPPPFYVPRKSRPALPRRRALSWTVSAITIYAVAWALWMLLRTPGGDMPPTHLALILKDQSDPRLWLEHAQSKKIHPFFHQRHQLISPVQRSAFGAQIQKKLGLLVVGNNNASHRGHFLPRPAGNVTWEIKIPRKEGGCQQIPSNLFGRTVFPLHGCAMEQAGPEVRYSNRRPYCRFRQLHIHANKVYFQRYGEKNLTTLWSDHNQGQDENMEYPRYQPGAFSTANRYSMPQEPTIKSTFYYIQDVLAALQVQDSPCTEGHSLGGTTLLIQRYEYANLYHAMSDWWNTWLVDSVERNTDVPPSRVIFLDAHPPGALDDVWGVLFHKYDRLSHLLTVDPSLSKETPAAEESSRTVCLESSILIPSGYMAEPFQSPLASSSCPDHTTTQFFVDFVLRRFNLTGIRRIPGRIVIIDRDPYLAHARSALRADDKVNNNLASTVLTYLRDHFRTTKSAPVGRNVNVSIHVVQLHQLPMQEQISTIRQAQIVVGEHGADLTHLIFMDQHSHVLEFEKSGGGSIIFGKLAEWPLHVGHNYLPTIERTLTQEYIDRYLVRALEMILQEQDGNATRLVMERITQFVINQRPSVT